MHLDHEHTVGAHSHEHDRHLTHEEMHAMGIPHDHDHDHSHDCAHDCTGCESHCEHTPMEELTALMQYMVGHNAAHARELAENETFICDLIGCKAVDRQGNELGTVTDVLQPGGNDVYVIQTPKGEMLLPALMHVVPKVDTANGRITINEDRLPEVAVCSWET